MTSKMTALLEHNERFALTFTPVPLGLPAAQVIVVAYLAFLGRRMAGGDLTEDMGVEVAIIHHTQCGTGFLADPDFRYEASQATGVDEDALEASTVAEPHSTVKTDVELLLSSPLLPPMMGVSGHVYDVETGRVTTVVDTRYPVATRT